jgi:hypothetical protein
MIQKDEQKEFYLYEVISKGAPNFDYIGTIVYKKRKDADPKFYKFLGSRRDAFVGNMQEDFDRYYRCNNMENFAKTVGQGKQPVIYRNIIKYRKSVSLYRKIKRRILMYFRDKQDGNYFNNLFNKQDK